MKKIPIITLCGFLGSGKTTLLRRWRRQESHEGAAVIVHDLSEFGLDAELLSGDEPTPKAGRLEGRVAALHGSHAREDLYDSVGAALDEISELEPAPPLVLCESTGAARPWPLIKALTQDERFFVTHFIVTVDALNLHRDFSDGRVLTGEADIGSDVALRQAAEVLAEQLAFASVIILTKIDTIPESVIEAQVQLLQQIQPQAAIGLSAQGGLSLEQLEGTPAPNLPTLTEWAEQLGLTGQSSTVDDIEAVVLRDPRPFHPQRLHDACQNHLGTGLYRTKGFLWLASRPRDVLLCQQSGSQIGLEITGYWKAEVVKNKDGKLQPDEVEQLQEFLQSQHPVFGDRHNELTLIGLKEARDGFAAALKDALCTNEEVAAWLQGEVFPDPWPQTIRRID